MESRGHEESQEGEHMNELSIDELIARSLFTAHNTPGAVDRTKQVIQMISDAMARENVPLYVAVGAFAALLEGARMYTEQEANARMGAGNGTN